MVKHRNTQLDQYKPIIEQNNYYAIEETNGHLYYTFPPGTPLMCAPLMIVIQQIGKRVFYVDTGSLLSGYYHGGIELFLAAFFVALAAAFLFLLLTSLDIDKWIVWLSVILFAFGTSAWSTASRGLFAHGPSMLLIIIGLWALVRSARNNNWLWLAGFVFGYAYITRPTNSISLAVFGIYTLWVYRMQAYKFIVPATVVVLLFFKFNYGIYGHILTPYYLPSKMGTDGNFFKGFSGNLFSPSRGLLINSPVFIMLFPLLGYMAFKKRVSALMVASIAVVILHTYIISSFDNWYSGWCFGARYFAEAIPYLIVLFAIGLQQFMQHQYGIYNKAAITGVLVLGLLSCYINYQGANNIHTFEWNYKPVDIIDSQNRVWDWHDIQFLR